MTPVGEIGATPRGAAPRGWRGPGFAGPLPTIHPSAWKGYSPKSRCSVLHTGTPGCVQGRVEAEPRHTGNHYLWWWRVDMHARGCTVVDAPPITAVPRAYCGSNVAPIADKLRPNGMRAVRLSGQYLPFTDDSMRLRHAVAAGHSLRAVMPAPPRPVAPPRWRAWR